MSAIATHDELFHIVAGILTAQLGINTPLSLETTLSENLGMDSIEIVELGVSLEQKLALSVSDAQLRTCITVEDICTVLQVATEQARSKEASV